MIKTPYIRILLAAVVAGLSISGPAFADRASDRADRIADRADRIAERLERRGKGRPEHLRAAFKDRFKPERREKIRKAIRAQERHQRNLMNRQGILGTAVSWDQDGNEIIKVYKDKYATAAALPESVDGIKVVVESIPKFYANNVPCAEREGCVEEIPDVNIPFVQPSSTQPPNQRDWHPRPVPIGVSAGHVDVSAGTLGCRVSQGCHQYALGNAHVFANENAGQVGDSITQPGKADGGIAPDDTIGSLFASKGIHMSLYAFNQIDAAIVSVEDGMVGTATRTNGYGEPISVTEETALDPVIGMNVMKYGRSSAMKYGYIDAINATVYVGYKEGNARFIQQIIIKTDTALSSTDFSRAGDSGSLIVANGGPDDRKAVGLLFASGSDGSTGEHITLANPIKFVLREFDVQIDGEVQ